MIENLPKNGSFLERKKLFVQFPFHSLNHHSAFQWPQDRSSQEKLRVKNRPSYEQEYIRRIYNEKMQRNLHQKFKAPLDSFRVIPNQITAKDQQDALNKEIQHFNQSKLLPSHNPEKQESFNQNLPLQRNYQSAKQINSKPSVDQLYYLPQLNPHRNNIYGPIRKHTNEGNPSENSREKQEEKAEAMQSINQRYSKQSPENYKEEKPDFFRGPYLRRNYEPQSSQSYQNYTDLINSSHLQPPSHPLRNYLPDRLEGYLRDNSKMQRRRPNNNSLSVQTRIKS